MTNKDKYEEIMGQVHTDPDLRAAFDAKAKDGLLDVDLTSEVLDEWSVILAFDLEGALVYFDLKNSPLPPEQIRKEMEFDDFVLIFEQWLEKELELGDDDQGSNRVPTPQVPIAPAKSQQSQLSQQSQVGNAPTVELVKQIFQNQEAGTRKVFNEYAYLSDGGDLVSQSDFPLILKNLLYRQDASVNQKVEEQVLSADAIRKIWQGIGINSEEDPVNFAQFKDAASKFLIDNPQLIIMDSQQTDNDNEKSMQVKSTIQSPKGSNVPQKSLEEELLQQIEKYQQYLQKSEAEIEKQVLRNMITTLVRQLDLMREQSIKLDDTAQQNTTMAAKKRNMHISFSNVVRPEKKSKTKEELEIENIDKRLGEIFLFFCKQQYVNGVAYDFDRYSKEAQQLSLGMFLYFCKQFNLIGVKQREPKNVNHLERKKRGEEVTVPDAKKLIAKESEKVVELKKVENLPRNNKYSAVPSKFEWWNDELKFDEFYHPNTNPDGSVNKDYLYFLTRDEIKNLFKRSSFGKDLDYEEFKCLLGFMANKMFIENGQRHPHAYQKLLQLLNIDDPEQYRQKLLPIKIPFNCKEKPGFREMPGYEHHQYKGHILTPAEKEKLQQLKAEREKYLKEKLSENVNSSIRSVGSLRSMMPTYQHQQGKLLNGRLDLDREKVSWGKLENLNPNDLSGHNRNFKPQDLIDEFEDEEDRFFLKEFSLEEEKKNQPKPEEVRKNLEQYGSYKPPKRPTQKNQQSQPNLYVPQEQQRYQQGHPYDLKKQYLQRANQIQQQQNQREQQLMRQINKQYKL